MVGKTRAVVFDAMGVLYQAGDDLVELLIPFAHEHGSTLSDDEIGAVYRRAMMGELTPRRLWTALGVDGDPAGLDEAYLAGHRLTPGILALVDELRGRGIVLGCISNDVAEWSSSLRTAHGLDRRITHWTISGDVGARKPHERIFRVFLADSGLTPETVTFVDDRVKNVDAAAALGFDAILVDLTGASPDPRCLRTVADLRGALLRRM